MLANYVVMDGFDLGAGIAYLFVARTQEERQQVIRAVGPVWDGNEVWLLSAGGTLLLAFPKVLSTSFSGFYLPLLIVVWLLILRALGIELRHYLNQRLWRQFWDGAFTFSSGLLALFFGAALGNVVRGVSFKGDGTFFAPLWTTFRVDGESGILDWYTILVGLLAVLALLQHGSLWLVYKTDGNVNQRSQKLARTVWFGVVIFSLIVTAASFWVQPNILQSVRTRPWGFIFAILSAVGLTGIQIMLRRCKELGAFLFSALFLYGLLGCAAIGVFPYLLPGRLPNEGLTLWNSASSFSSLKQGILWWIPGMILVAVYFTIIYKNLPKKISSESTSKS